MTYWNKSFLMWRLYLGQKLCRQRSTTYTETNMNLKLSALKHKDTFSKRQIFFISYNCGQIRSYMLCYMLVVKSGWTDYYMEVLRSLMCNHLMEQFEITTIHLGAPKRTIPLFFINPNYLNIMYGIRFNKTKRHRPWRT